MNKPVIFIDDYEHERRSCADVLKELFADTEVQIEARAPLPVLENYASLVANDEAAAFILDERLNTSGAVNYTGVELAAHLRAIGSSLPIVILTNFPDDEDDFKPRDWAVESIVAKKDVVKDPLSSTAQAFKARLCRQINTIGALKAETEKKYHDLLVKSAGGALTTEEDSELRSIEAARIAPVAAAEREKQQKLDTEIETLKRLLGSERMF
jgi:DNA-binding NarL/FixJ family response regulator